MAMLATNGATLVSTITTRSLEMRIAIFVVLALLGSALIAIAAQVTVPFFPVPMTLQTLAVLGLAAAYGRNLAIATVALYIGEALMGLPVLAKFAFGPAAVFGPTGGYIFGFLVAAAIVGHFADKGWSKSVFKIGGIMLVADVVVFAMGMAWLAYMIPSLRDFDKVFTAGAAPFIYGDLAKIALAAAGVTLGWALLGKRKEG